MVCLVQSVFFYMHSSNQQQRRSDDDVSHCESFFLALHRLHRFLAAYQFAIVRDRESLLNELFGVFWAQELEVTERDHRFDDHADWHLDLRREPVAGDHIFKAVVLEELMNLSHARLA